MSTRRGSIRRATRVLTAALTLAGIGAVALLPAASAAASTSTGCSLGPSGQIKHVVIIQFDNVHLQRDNSNVPSDIQQIPALYDFMRDNGTLLANDHTVLISHTADGILSTETGLYPDEFGGGVANTFPYLSATAKSGTSTTSLFTYWTDTTSKSDPLYTLIHGAASSSNPEGINTPAPWAAFTRAGCDFAGVGSADMEFENDTSDVANVFGSNSPQYAFGNWSYNTAYDQKFFAGSDIGETDFEGLAIHCSKADSGPHGKCSTANGGASDALPDEPGGYAGYNALFGALNVDPLLTGKADQPLPANYTPAGDTPPPAGNWQAPPVYDVFAPNATDTGPHAAAVTNLDANTLPAPPTSYRPGVTHTSQVLDEDGQGGFPGFDGMEANNALGYTAAMQEAGVPVTYTYISDVHDDQYGENHGNAFGPGELGHELQLQEYNAAFAAFFHRLARDGINKSNTLFLTTVDEGDHYDGSAPLNPGCDGVHTPCEYDSAEAGGAAYGTPGYTRNVGEVDTSLPGLLKSLYGNTTTFGFDFDDAPALVVPNQTTPEGGARPGPNDPTVRTLERDLSAAKEYNPITGTTVPITVNMADEYEETILHMVNADPNREPTLTLFGDPSFYFQSSCDGNTSAPGCPVQNNGFAWNHGDIQPEIATTWQGWVGPGIKHLGETSSIWTDHTDARPTMMTVLGLHDDYSWDGAAIAQIIGSAHSGWDPWGGGQSALPWTIRANQRGYEDLAAAYKQLDAPFGEFGLNTLDADTTALAGGSSSNDTAYTGTTSQLQACESRRTSLVGQIQPVLEAAEGGKAPVSSWQAFNLIGQADKLIADAKTLAASSTPPSHTVCS